MTFFSGRQSVFTKSSKVLSVTMDLTQLQEVGAFGAILIESLKQSKSTSSNLSQAGKMLLCIFKMAAYEGA